MLKRFSTGTHPKSSTTTRPKEAFLELSPTGRSGRATPNTLMISANFGMQSTSSRKSLPKSIAALTCITHKLTIERRDCPMSSSGSYLLPYTFELSDNAAVEAQRKSSRCTGERRRSVNASGFSARTRKSAVRPRSAQNRIAKRDDLSNSGSGRLKVKHLFCAEASGLCGRKRTKPDCALVVASHELLLCALF